MTGQKEQLLTKKKRKKMKLPVNKEMNEVLYYTIKQDQKVKSFFGSRVKQITYKFKTYIKALEFAIHEQIKVITAHICEGVEKKIYPFKNILTLDQYKKLANINPMHYIGTRSAKGINLDHYYIYLFNTGQLQKLKKYNKQK
jgi:uncharacterized FlaG/YvyC family protein